MRTRFLLVVALLALPALAQRPSSEPDDFIDPALHTRPIFLSRIVAGAVWNPEDRFRPIDGDKGVVLLTNSVYWNRWQFDYKHTEATGDDPPELKRCDCPDPVYFPTPPPGDATPAGPQPGRGDTVQLAFYTTSSGPVPLTKRYRLSFTRQELHTVVNALNTGERLERRSGHDQSIVVDADTHFRILGRDVWGSLYFARASRQGTPHEDRAQNEFAYVWRPPGFAAGEVLFRPKLTIGGLSGRGATSLNLVNPYFEAFWRHRPTKVNFHLVWSPQVTRDGQRWRTNHEIAVFADYTLWLTLIGRSRE